MNLIFSNVTQFRLQVELVHLAACNHIRQNVDKLILDAPNDHPCKIE